MIHWKITVVFLLHWVYQPKISKNSSDFSLEDNCTVLIFWTLFWLWVTYLKCSSLTAKSVMNLYPLRSFNRGTSLPTCFYFLHSPNPQILTEELSAKDCTLVLARTKASLIALESFLPPGSCKHKALPPKPLASDSCLCLKASGCLLASRAQPMWNIAFAVCSLPA